MLRVNSPYLEIPRTYKMTVSWIYHTTCRHPSHTGHLILPSPPHRMHLREEQGIKHYSDVILGAIASQITSLTIVYSTVYSDADQRKHQSSASLAFVRGIHRGPVNSTHKWPVTRKMFPFNDVITSHSNSDIMYMYVAFMCVHVCCKGEYTVINLRTHARTNKHIIHFLSSYIWPN